MYNCSSSSFSGDAGIVRVLPTRATAVADSIQVEGVLRAQPNTTPIPPPRPLRTTLQTLPSVLHHVAP